MQGWGRTALNQQQASAQPDCFSAGSTAAPIGSSGWSLARAPRFRLELLDLGQRLVGVFQGVVLQPLQHRNTFCPLSSILTGTPIDPSRTSCRPDSTPAPRPAGDPRAELGQVRLDLGVLYVTAVGRDGRGRERSGRTDFWLWPSARQRWARCLFSIAWAFLTQPLQQRNTFCPSSRSLTRAYPSSRAGCRRTGQNPGPRPARRSAGLSLARTVLALSSSSRVMDGRADVVAER